MHRVDAVPVPCCLPHYLETIIENRVNNVALTAIQRFVDKLCSWLWCGYAEYVAYRMAQQGARAPQENIEGGQQEEGAGLFLNGVQLNVQIEREEIVKVAFLDSQDPEGIPVDEITINDRQLILHSVGGRQAVDVVFGSDYGTARLFVEEDPDAAAPGCYIIREEETPAQEGARAGEKLWHIDTRINYFMQGFITGEKFFYREGQQNTLPQNRFPIGSPEPVYVAREALADGIYAEPAEILALQDQALERARNPGGPVENMADFLHEVFG